jgi:hypothetical protein
LVGSFFSQTFFYIFMLPIKTFGNMAGMCLANLSLLFAHFLEYSHYCLSVGEKVSYTL